MALMSELTNVGRVVGGRLVNGTVSSDQSRKGGLAVQDPRNPFKRHKINADTVVEWEELATKAGVGAVMGQAAARAALPGMVGKALGAGLGAAMHSGHTVRVSWAEGEQSVIELPEKLFTVFSVLLKAQQVVTESSPRPESADATPAPGVTEKVVNLASSVLLRGKAGGPAEIAAPTDVTEQIRKLASLHDAGILTDEEFAAKKAELLLRL